MSVVKSPLVDLKFQYIAHETDLAYMFYFSDEDDAVWIPKSQCEVDEEDCIVTMKETLAIEKEIEGYAT